MVDGARAGVTPTPLEPGERPTGAPGLGRRALRTLRVASVVQVAGGAMITTLVLAAAQAANLSAHLPFVTTSPATQLMPLLWVVSIPVGLMLIRSCLIFPERRVRAYAGVLISGLSLILLTVESADVLAFEYVGPLAFVPGAFVFAHAAWLVMVFWTPQHVLWPSLGRQDRLVGISTSSALLFLIVLSDLGQDQGWTERGVGMGLSAAVVGAFLAWYGWRRFRATPGISTAALTAMVVAGAAGTVDRLTGWDLIGVGLLLAHVMAARPAYLMVQAVMRQRPAFANLFAAQ